MTSNTPAAIRQDSKTKADDVVELRFRTSRNVRFHCSWVAEDGSEITQDDVQRVMTMLELMLDTFADAPRPAGRTEGGEVES